MTQKLNAGERQLLAWPPNPETWDCGRIRESLEIVDGSPTTVKTTCTGRNSGLRSVCAYCLRPKRKGAFKPWTLYVAACKKAGIEPGTRWPVKAAPIEASQPAKPTRRKGK